MRITISPVCFFMEVMKCYGSLIVAGYLGERGRKAAGKGGEEKGGGGRRTEERRREEEREE